MKLNATKFIKVKCTSCGKEFTHQQDPARSIPENSYYWIIVTMLSDEIGYSKNEMHEVLKEMFLREPKYLKTKEGVKEIWITTSTANLSVSAFEDYLEQIRQWAVMNLGISIPEPNEGGNNGD